MKEPMKDLPVRKSPFSDKVKGVEMFVEDWGEMTCGRYIYPKGVDFTPYFVGMPDDFARFLLWVLPKRRFSCPLQGRNGGSRDSWGPVLLPPPHTFWIDEDTEMIMFSPLKLMSEGVKLQQSNLGSKK